MLSSIVKVNITRDTKVPTQKGFGVPAIISPEADSKLAERVQEFSSETVLEELVALGFTTGSEVYKCAKALISQSPKIEKLKVIKQAASVAQVEKVTIDTVADSTTYTVTLNGIDFEYTSGVGATDTSIRDGLIALIDADAKFGAALDQTNSFDITAAEAGRAFSAAVSANLSVANQTANLGPVEELMAAQEVDDDWYFLLTTDHDNLQAELLAGYIETQVKLFGYQTDDADSKDVSESSDANGIMKLLKDKQYDRSFGVWVPSDDLGEYKIAAWVGKAAPTDPGSITWKFKRAAGITADKFTSQELKNVQDKNGNVYVTIGGLNMFQEGVVASGEFIDIMRGTDWIQARIQEKVFGLFTSEPKVPYDDGGIESVGLQVEDVLGRAVDRQILVGPSNLDAEGNSLGPVVTVPKRSETTKADRASRFLRDVKFTGNYAGAIHKVQIDGTLSV